LLQKKKLSPGEAWSAWCSMLTALGDMGIGRPCLLPPTSTGHTRGWSLPDDLHSLHSCKTVCPNYHQRPLLELVYKTFVCDPHLQSKATCWRGETEAGLLRELWN
jgi:hypothetical protein